MVKRIKGQASPDVKIMIVGNKCDLEDERKVSIEEGKEFKEKNNLNYFMEASAKTGFNAKNVLIEAAKILYRDYLVNKNLYENEDSIDNVKVKNMDSITVKRKSCC